ncbi:hypothetical protein ACODT5_02235 [Streptomyces sp. 5.8]|uniref:hypothetical protein n=1 Tax=Streptomyces sp. 5.8 TaxID=3406571 RepID=UPI003BB74236
MLEQLSYMARQSGEHANGTLRRIRWDEDALLCFAWIANRLAFITWKNGTFMRLRTTAAVLVGAMAIILPTASQALADDSNAFNYTFMKAGKPQHAQINDLSEEKCHDLAVANGSVTEIANETKKVALLFDNATCSGEPVLAAEPGDRAGDFKAVAVAFADTKPGSEVLADRMGVWTGPKAFDFATHVFQPIK